MAEFFVTICTCVLSLIILFTLSNAQHDVISFGARADGIANSAPAFIEAWKTACASYRPSSVIVPQGTFLINNVIFQGPCKAKMVILLHGNIVAPSDYRIIGKYENWMLFRLVNWLSIVGHGTIDGKGAGFWDCRKAGKKCPVGATSLSFSGCNNVWINGLTSINSQKMHMSLDGCNKVDIRNVNIRAPSDSPNTDGIQLKGTTSINITYSTIMTGDDCVAISQGSKNVWIEHINCGPGHGVSIGSLGDFAVEKGVENVTVTNSIFTNTQNGVRIKSWARPSNGFARNIVFQNLVMRSASNPIIIDQNYCPGGRGCPSQSSGVKIYQVSYKNIKGVSASQIAMNFKCSPSNPCREIKLYDINLSVVGKPALSYCKNVQGSSSKVVSPRSCI